MRPRIITQTGVGTSAPFPVDWRQQNFQVSLMCEVIGTATYSIQHTLDNIIDGKNTNTPLWLDKSDLSGKTANAEGSYLAPIAAFRINVTSGTGTVKVRFLQQSGSE